MKFVPFWFVDAWFVDRRFVGGRFAGRCFADRCFAGRLLGAALSCALSLASLASSQAKNLLFYGNSYSERNGTVGDFVQFIAEAAGHPSPTVVMRLNGGSTLNYHRTNSGQVAAISNSLPPGEAWDTVVMQGQSLEATDTQGNPAAFRSNAVSILTNVRNHSPAATAVMYQTWARAHGASVYPGTYAVPLDMHAEIHANYRLAVSDIDAAHGAGAAANAAVGDATALWQFAPSFYEADLTHPAPAMTLFASMVIYTAVYRELACEVDPDFGVASNLLSRMSTLGLTAADWQGLVGIADRVADPSLRRFAGSGECLLLRSSVNAPLNECSDERLGLGHFLNVRMESRNGVYDPTFAIMLLDAYPNGAPPGPDARYPEIRVDLSRAAVLLTAPVLSAAGVTFFAPFPFSLPGTTMMLQGVAFGPSVEQGNPSFTATDAHTFEFQ